jgi:PTS system fructose-specific IIC component
MKIVAVTACITGIAHTYMAAEALERAAKELGHEIKVETQGSGGAQRVSQEWIDEADIAIFCVDLEVGGKDRFAGKPYVQVPVAKALRGSVDLINNLIEQVSNGTAPLVGSAAAPAATQPKPVASDNGEKKGGLFSGLFKKK